MQQPISTRSQESGAVLSFVLVTIVLLGLLAGGLWFIKNRTDIASQANDVANQTKDETKDTTNKDNQPAATGDSSDDEQPAPAETPAPTAPAPAATPKPSEVTATGPSAVASTGPSNIAATGPADVLSNAFLLSSLVIVGHLYRQSRHHQR